MAQPSQGVGPVDVATQIAAGLAPLNDVVAALATNNNLLSGIHQTLLGGATGPTPAQRSGTLGLLGPNGQPIAPPSGPQAGSVTAAQLQAAATAAAARAAAQNPGSPPPGQPVPPPVPAPAPGGPARPPAGPPAGAPVTPPPSGGSGGSGGPPPTPTPSTPQNSGAALAQGIGASSGTGLVNRIYGGIVSKVPIVGIPNAIRNEYQSQVNKNNWYIGMAGAKDGKAAIDQRFEEETDRFRYGKLFSEEESRFATKGTILNGYTNGSDGMYQGRATQREATDFLYNSKKAFGATPEETIQYQATASRAATQNLNELVTQLDALTESVDKAGGNAMQARKNFDKAFNIGLSGGMTGAAAQQLASAATSANTELGPQFANSDSVSKIAGNTGYQALIAAQMGITPGALTSQRSTNAAAVAGAQTQTFINYMRSYIQASNPDGWRWLEQEATSGERSIGVVAEDFVANHFGNLTEAAFVSMAQTFGIETSESLTDAISVTRYLVKEMRGQGTVAKLTADSAKVGATDAKTGKSKDISGAKGSGISMSDLMPTGKDAEEAKKFAEITGDKSVLPSEATQAYASQVKKTGTQYGAIDMMLGAMDSKQEGSQKVEVETGSGRRVVSLAEAVKNYSGQLRSGKARFVGGDKNGENIAAYTGGAVDSSETSTKAAMEETKKQTKAGQSADAYYKEHPEDKAKSAFKGPRVKIDLSDRAAHVLKAVVYDDSDNAAGEPKENRNGIGGNVKSGVMTFLKVNPVTSPAANILDKVF